LINISVQQNKNKFGEAEMNVKGCLYFNNSSQFLWQVLHRKQWHFMVG